jgi:hypothetical protein
MLFSSRGGYYVVLVRVGSFNSYTGRGTDDRDRRTIFLVLQWLRDYWGGFPSFNSKGCCFVVNRGVGEGTRGRGNQGLEIWGGNS